MSERILGSWTKDEDRLLIQAVTQWGSENNWQAVASLVPGRTNKACRKRWLHSLAPTLKKTAWTYEEDRTLMHLYNTHGPKWSYIARYIDGRTDDACSKRYREALAPNLKKDAWTTEEDAKLSQIVAEKGPKWKEISQELRVRSPLDCRNRWRLIERKNRSKASLPALNTVDHVEQSDFSMGAVPIFSVPYVWPLLYPERDVSFNFSSSSLCNALSEQHVTRAREPQIAMNSGSDSSPASLPLSLPHDVDYVADIPLPDLAFPVLYSEAQCSSQTQPDSSPCNQIPQADSSNSPVNSSSLHHHPIIPLIEDSFLQEVHPSSNFSECVHEAPMLSAQDMNPYDDLSSTASSPFGLTTALSPGQSPCGSTSIELPSVESFSQSPLLFSSNAFQGRGSFSIRPMKKKRLSSQTALADETVQPYACAHSSCWPSGSACGKSCFRTSAQLLDHWKANHSDDKTTEKPFRCALPDCGRSWKNLNGLQYHLQISTAHFEAALTGRFSGNQRKSLSSSPESEEASLDPIGGDKEERSFTCTLCSKSYRHASGLRYHMKHGHQKRQPHQLSNVPPTVERASIRLRRMYAGSVEKL